MIAMTPNEMEKAIKKANETTVKYTDIDEVSVVFAKLGIQVKNQDGSFKCWFDILNEISEAWKKVSVDKDV